MVFFICLISIKYQLVVEQIPDLMQTQQYFCHQVFEEMFEHSLTHQRFQQKPGANIH